MSPTLFERELCDTSNWSNVTGTILPVEWEKVVVKKPLYWSTLKMYEECPQRCLWTRGYAGIDLGAGDGRPKPGKKKKSEHHAVMGIVIADVMELFYNNEMWRRPSTLRDELEQLTGEFFEKTVSKKYIEWGSGWTPTKTEMFKVCLDGVLNYIGTMRENKILGSYARAEVDLRTQIDKYNPIGGRADLIVRRSDNGITIYDGKNSKHVGTYTDPDQLRWYALCFKLAYNQMPDRLAFIYFRYPFGSPPEGKSEEEWTGIVEVPFTKDDLRGLAHRARTASKSMWKGKWEANPSPSNCKFCEYEHVCSARQDQRQSRSRKKNLPPMQEGLITLGGGGKKASLVEGSGGNENE